MNNDYIDQYERAFRNRYRVKKIVSTIVDLLIFLSAVIGIYDSVFVRNYILVDRLRYMTWIGSIFTSLVCLAFSIVNIIQLITNNEHTSVLAYYMRLSSATTELLIFTVVIIGLLPTVPDKPDFTSITGFVMHLFIPIATILSFIFSDVPIGKLRGLKPFNGTWFITIYAVVIMFLLISGLLSQELAPYSFLNIYKNPLWYSTIVLIIIYALSFSFAKLLSNLNLKFTWFWYKDIKTKKNVTNN